MSTLHAPEYDDYEYTFSDEARTIKTFEEIFAYFNDKGQIKNITCGKKHSLILTSIHSSAAPSPARKPSPAAPF